MVEILTCVAVFLSLINFIFNIIIFRKVKFNEFRMLNQFASDAKGSGIVFCRKCGSKYSASLQKCPVCGEIRH